MTGGGLPGASPLPSLAEEGGSGGSVGMSSGMVPGTTNTLAGGTVLPLSRSNVMLMNIPEGDESTGELFSKNIVFCLYHEIFILVTALTYITLFSLDYSFFLLFLETHVSENIVLTTMKYIYITCQSYIH